jgi:hypothetical protein
MWSKLKKEYDDGTFDTQDVNRTPIRFLFKDYAKQS